MSRHSPCVGICTLDGTSGFCLGCGRSRDEIGEWIAMSEEQRDAVWLRLPQRLAKLSVGVRLLPWTPAEILRWISGTLLARSGIWSLGIDRSALGFAAGKNRDIDVERRGDSVVARCRQTSLRIVVADKLRAFDLSDRDRIVLGLPNGRARLPASTTIQSLGADTSAVEAVNRDLPLFDLGLGHPFRRLLVRPRTAGLTTRLSADIGNQWLNSEFASAADIVRSDFDLVIETAAARIELAAPISPPIGHSKAGSPVHELFQNLTSLAAIEPKIEIPAFATPVAIFYPQEFRVAVEPTARA